jgi:hypothetical protein
VNKTKALKLSIAKWELIAAGLIGDKGIENCALCVKYYDGDCKGCPVMEDTGHHQCQGSPYEKWDDDLQKYEDENGFEYDKGGFAHTPELKTRAREMYRYLCRLLKEHE